MKLDLTLPKIPSWAITVVLIAGFFLFQHFQHAFESSDVVPSDPAVVKLGKNYRAAFTAAGRRGLEAGSQSTATTAPELIRAQSDALDGAVKQAAAQIVSELKGRYPDPSTAPVESVKAFNRDLLAGWGTK